MPKLNELTLEDNPICDNKKDYLEKIIEECGNL
jgi:hypothetical protein